jgi:glycosyltransferase involved in cell wall biosynthesis
MNATPRVTALMVNRNNGRFIGEAIESVMAQDYGRWELVVVENASTDNSRDIMRHWMRQESRIRLISLTCPVAIPAARNVALAQALGEYIATIDSDDVWLPDRLSRQIEFMERPGHEKVGVCGSNVWLIDELGRTTGIKEFPDRHARCLQALWFRNPLCHSATLIPRSVLSRCGQYDESFAAAEDLELWFRIGRNFELINLGDCLVKYRIWRGNITSQRHRSMVRYTLRARRLAVTRYGYRFGVRGRTALVATWLAQWLPAGLARAIFEKCFLLRSSPRPTESGIGSRYSPPSELREDARGEDEGRARERGRSRAGFMERAS